MPDQSHEDYCRRYAAEQIADLAKTQVDEVAAELYDLAAKLAGGKL